jgi:NAD(P)-dependent dehydrogenase (short-subunit alcohol dehydrogenase family)
MTESLAGAVAIVTGGGGGLGRSLGRMLVEAGVTVVVADVRHSAAEQATAELRERGGLAEPLALDVLDADAEAAVEPVYHRHDRLDIPVNNAGADVTLPVEEVSVAHWDRIVGVNLRAPFVLSRAAFPCLRHQGGGSIANSVSTATKRAWDNAMAYHASKWGPLGLSCALHVEGRPLGIKVTAVIAGGMRTPFLLDRFPELDPGLLRDPATVAATARFVPTQPTESELPDVMVLPMWETSWP